MDGHDFDTLTKRLAQGVTRRSILRTFGGAIASIAGGVSLRSASAASCRPPGGICREHGNCCSGLCGPLDRLGRHTCQCQTGADCPTPNNKCLEATCDAGVCGTSGGVTCTALDECHRVGDCNPSTGSCSNPVASDGTACGDGNVCTAGVCAGVNLCTGVVCTAQDQCHVAGVCDPATGICSNPNAPDSTSCNDDNACTTGDTCQAGVCSGGAPTVCTTDDPCREAYCDQGSGCQTRLKSAGTGCGDGNTCNGTEVCNAEGQCVSGTPVSCGTCLRCNATDGSCEPDPALIGQSCTPPDGADLCSSGYQCNAGGACAGVNPVVCTAQDQCHTVGTCDSSTGVCSNPDKADDTTCNVDNLCTSGDTCQEGVCTGGTAVVCTSQGTCRAVGTCDPATGICSNPQAPQGTPCDDGNICTENTVCSNGGTCGGGNAITCGGSNYCSTGFCDSILGCQYQFASPRTISDEETCFMQVCEPRTSDWVVVPTGQCSPCLLGEGNHCETQAECCAGHVCGPYDFGGFVDTACVPPCGVSGGCRTSCDSYILAGELAITDSIYVDDDLRVSINGVTIFDSANLSPGYYVAPIGPFSASAGDVLKVEATNTFGGCQSLGRVSLFCADGSISQLVSEGYFVECRNAATEDPYDYFQPTTTPYLTASITIDI